MPLTIFSANQLGIVVGVIWLVFLLFLLTIFEVIDGLIASRLIQKVLSTVLILAIVIDTILIISLKPALWTGLLTYFSLFRLINLVRLFEERKQKDYLRSVFLRSSLVLAMFQLLVVGLTYLTKVSGLSFRGKWQVFSLFELVALVIVAGSLRRSLIKTRPDLEAVSTSSDKLPTLTVAIPARNETDELKACLQSLVASDYQKLEILVLDDCSSEPKTPEIIRQFAHDGVKFIVGKPPKSSWLAKNYAYEQLAQEANGQLILFCGVDARFEPHSLSQMVNVLLAKNKKMISFMPLNSLANARFKRLLVQPIRYLWELGLPRRKFNRPPVLSTCWLIDKQSLLDNGSFKAVSREIIPERYFAKQTAKQSDGYSFICLGKDLGLSSNKSFQDQLETAIRVRYPRLRQRLEYAASLSLLETSVYVLPLGLTIYALASSNWFMVIVSALNSLIASLIFYNITKLTYVQSLPLSLITYPLVFIYDIGLELYSMWRYEFSEVIWKGRNVCIPVMYGSTRQLEAASQEPFVARKGS